MIYKDDLDKAQERLKAWWEGEIIDRVVIQIIAPREPGYNVYWDWWYLVHNLDCPEKVFQDFEEHCKKVYFGGEALPNLWINFGPGIVAAYIGAEPKIREDTVWFETPKSWEKIFQEVKFDPDNKWWNLTKNITAKAVEFSNGKFFIGITDLGGVLDIPASLRGTQNLLIDLFDFPDKVKQLSKEINQLWFKYYEELYQITQKNMKGTTTWMGMLGIWSPKKWYPVQCDFSAMLSPKMFEEFVVPYLQEQCRWLDHSIYHWDGPGQIPHLDLLLEIPELTGIQWTPGAGNPPTDSPKWFPFYKKIQSKNKLLVLLWVEKRNIESLLNELSPKGLLITTYCNSEEEAKELLKQAEKWTKSSLRNR